MLQELLNEQKRLNNIIVDNFDDIINSNDDVIKREWLSKMFIAMICECSEFVESSGWKWWKQIPDWTDEVKHNIQVELIDILHFLLSSMIIMGMNADDIYNLYMKKNKLNEKRQEDGYKDGSYKKIDEQGKEDNYYLK